MTSFIFLTFLFISSFGQSEIELPIKEQFDVVTMEWIDKSEYLKTYSGINEYCQNPVFRKSVDRVLTSIHQYDSLIISTLNDPTAYFNWDAKEERKTLSDIASMETGYSTHAFIDKMRDACIFRNEIESNAKNLRNGVGYESYDAKIVLLETDVIRYLNKIDKLVVKINDHLHVLDIDLSQ
ncbi:MAG: hypothetical protein GDA42_10585 [Ekhidna sp.]|nr:hypothetical protein [Ekhidna sp.]MBC6410881.1 hypothetical protein [Ekhidna sp.]